VIRPGRWENLPSGELMTAPAHVQGVFVADGSIGGPFGAAAGLLSSNPVRFEIEDSVVKRVECSDIGLQREVEGFMRRDLYADHVGTVILGTNIGITAPVGELVCDQNLPGLHLSLGSTFPEKTGGANRTRAQLTMTCARADVDLDGAPLVRAGRYMIG
jgi:leucyl aminopeptidase (aminopeptidase T)